MGQVRWLSAFRDAMVPEAVDIAQTGRGRRSQPEQIMCRLVTKHVIEKRHGRGRSRDFSCFTLITGEFPLNTKCLATLAVVSLAAAASAQAQTTRDAPNPWLDCGIGAMIFPDANLEVGAGISNVTWDLGTTAVTSAQSSPDTCNGLDNVNMAIFIKRTYPSLEAELAEGRGENLTTLASLVGAENEEAFVADLRARMALEVSKEEFAGLTEDEKAQALYAAARASVLG